ncbi:MAG TPA: LacI family DNA-binding transcriptional regulator [bacterium]|jgi:LacI family transcriptional regulator|nr:LacI family DNA-binding transcriptional regulator [bacterium]
MRRRREKTPTVRDVARRAGVSPSTVSRILTGITPVSPEKRQRVERAIRRLGYRPNALARGLKQRRSYSIGLLIPDITNPYFAEAAKGVEEAAQRGGFAVLLCDSENDLGREARYLEVLRERQVDGLIFVTAGDGAGLLRSWQGRPLVVMDREVPGLAADSVSTDNARGAYDITRVLLERGHRHVAFLAGPQTLAPARLRLRGYRRALREFKIPIRPDLIHNAGFTVEGGRTAMQAVLRSSLRPTAVVASSDVMALGAVQAIEDAGLRVPADISVVGFDDIPVAALVRPPLTTVAQPVRQMGEAAVRLLLEQFAEGGRAPGPRRILLQPRVIIRESVGAAPA